MISRNTIFSELIGKLPIITVNISFKNVSHNSQYICNCYLDICDSKSLLHNMLVYIMTYVHIVT